MSTLNTTNIKHPSSASNNIVLDSSGNTRVTAITDSAGANSSTPAAIANGTAKAWVNFNGTSTVAIRASYNVSSITDNGTGDYTVNFTTAMVDANHAVNVSSYKLNSFNEFVYISGPTQTASSVRIANASTSGTFFDTDFIYVVVFR